MAKKDSQEQQTLAIITHILGMFIYFLGPLIILLASENEYIRKHSRLALNWQISLIIYSLISTILIFLLIGFPLLIMLSVLNIVFPIIAAVKASENKLWKYPLTIEFFKVKI